MLDVFSFCIGEYHFRGGARNFATEGPELPTGGGAKMTGKWEIVVSCFILPNFLRREPDIFSDGGLDASDGGLYPLSPPMAPPLYHFRNLNDFRDVGCSHTVEHALVTP